MERADRAALIRLLEDGRNAEEKSILLYTKHLASAVFWTGVAPEQARRAQEILQQLARESAAHKILVERMLASLAKEA